MESEITRQKHLEILLFMINKPSSIYLMLLVYVRMCEIIGNPDQVMFSIRGHLSSCNKHKRFHSRKFELYIVISTVSADVHANCFDRCEHTSLFVVVNQAAVTRCTDVLIVSTSERLGLVVTPSP